MRSELEITYDGMNALIEKLGIIEAEKFISIINQDSFDYTEWRKKLWPDKTVRELSNEAMEFRNKKRALKYGE